MWKTGQAELGLWARGVCPDLVSATSAGIHVIGTLLRGKDRDEGKTELWLRAMSCPVPLAQHTPPYRGPDCAMGAAHTADVAMNCLIFSPDQLGRRAATVPATSSSFSTSIPLQTEGLMGSGADPGTVLEATPGVPSLAPRGSRIAGDCAPSHV